MNAMRGTKSRFHFVPSVPPLQGLVDVWGHVTRPSRPGYHIAGLQPSDLPPLAGQHPTVAELDALQAEVKALKSLPAPTADELDAVLPALLDRGFIGEL